MSDDDRRLDSNLGPVSEERDATNLRVLGELPPGLNGTLFRNGPNPQFPPADPLRDHWFAGDGMIHAFTIEDGQASYRNRWVRTPKFLAERAAGRSLGAGFAMPATSSEAPANMGVANTNVVWHAGRLLALEEAHLPVELDRATLATHGEQNFDGALDGRFTAHPKIDPVTGEMVFFGYSANGPFTPGMTYGTFGPDGRVTRREQFEAPYASMVHDFAVTERHVLFPVLPLSGSLPRARAGQSPYAWEPELGAYVGLIRRDQGVASLRWFRVETCFVFHVLNAWDEGGRIVADVMEYEAAPLFPRADGGSRPHHAGARLTRWTLDPDAGTEAFSRARLDDMDGEFPRLDERRAGLPNRFGSFVGISQAGRGLDTLVWLDLASGRRAAYTVPQGDGLSEAVFVPRTADAPEGDGWLLAVAWRGEERRSDLLVLETDAIDRGPVATVQLTHRVPSGFHGNWLNSPT